MITSINIKNKYNPENTIELLLGDKIRFDLKFPHIHLKGIGFLDEIINKTCIAVEIGDSSRHHISWLNCENLVAYHSPTALNNSGIQATITTI